MILFCEECGAKNSLRQAPAPGEPARFRCTECGYQNTIVQQIGHTGPSDADEALLDTIQSHPDTVGAFLVHRSHGLMSHRMPESLQLEDLDVLGSLLTRNFQAGQDLFPDVNRLVLVIKNRNIVVQMLRKDITLVVTCMDYPLSLKLNRLLDRALEKAAGGTAP